MVYQTIGTGDTALGGLSYEAILEVATCDNSLLIVPIGSTEQHGPHLPVATDTILADAVARVTAEQLPADAPVLVTPPISIGYSPHHLPFGGTITLPFNVVLTVLQHVAESTFSSGFDTILFLNGHTGNNPIIQGAVSTVGNAYPQSDAYGLTYFQLLEPYIEDIRDSKIGGMGHGGELETSLLLHLRPDLVNMERADVTYRQEPHELAIQDMFHGGILSIYRPFTEYTSTGVVGDPELASPTKGKKLFEIICDELQELLLEISAYD